VFRRDSPFITIGYKIRNIIHSLHVPAQEWDSHSHEEHEPKEDPEILPVRNLGFELPLSYNYLR
jgi:hypothetical protein